MKHRHLTIVSSVSSEPGNVRKSCSGSQSVSCRMGECWRLFRWFLRGGAPFKTLWRRCVSRSRDARVTVVPVRAREVVPTDKKAASGK